jgi:hypothetical protein
VTDSGVTTLLNVDSDGDGVAVITSVPYGIEIRHIPKEHFEFLEKYAKSAEDPKVGAEILMLASKVVSSNLSIDHTFRLDTDRAFGILREQFSDQVKKGGGGEQYWIFVSLRLVHPQDIDLMRELAMKLTNRFSIFLIDHSDDMNVAAITVLLG